MDRQESIWTRRNKYVCLGCCAVVIIVVDPCAIEIAHTMKNTAVPVAATFRWAPPARPIILRLETSRACHEETGAFPPTAAATPSHPPHPVWPRPQAPAVPTSSVSAPAHSHHSVRPRRLKCPGTRLNRRWAPLEPRRPRQRSLRRTPCGPLPLTNRPWAPSQRRGSRPPPCCRTPFGTHGCFGIDHQSLRQMGTSNTTKHFTP